MDKNKIVCIDCLKGLKQLEDNSIDIIIADPPYNLGKNYGKYSSDRLPEDEYWKWIEEVFSECYRVHGPGYLYVFNSDQGIFKLKPLLEDLGYKFWQLLIWHGPNGYGIRLKFGWAYRHEPFLMLTKGDAPPLLSGKNYKWYTSVFRFTRPQRNYKEGRYHPTQKPVGLFEAILSRTPGKTLLDPFAGSGASLKAATHSGLDFYAFDINPNYVTRGNIEIHKVSGQTKLNKNEKGN